MNDSLGLAVNDLSATPGANEALDTLDAPPPSRFKKVTRGVAWVAFAFVCLVTFTLFKFPEERIRAYIDGTLHTLLAPRGMSLQAEEARVGLLFGMSYTMYRAQLRMAGQDAPLVIEKIKVSPSLLSLALGTLAGSFVVENAGGSLDGSFQVGMSEKDSSLRLDIEASKLDIGKLGLLKALAGVGVSGVLDGTVRLNGDLDVPSTLEGAVTLSLKKAALEAQSIAGFSIPRVAVPELNLDVLAEKGKLQIKTLKFAPGGDLWGAVSGSIALGKQWETSGLDLKTNFGISEAILKAFVLIDAILGAGKAADGTYSFVVGGTLGAPFPNPATP